MSSIKFSAEVEDGAGTAGCTRTAKCEDGDRIDSDAAGLSLCLVLKDTIPRPFETIAHALLYLESERCFSDAQVLAAEDALLSAAQSVTEAWAKLDRNLNRLLEESKC